MNLLLIFLLMAHTVSPYQSHLNAVLMRAAASGDTRKITIRLQEGADINARTLLGHTPLELAVEYHHFEAVDLLLDHRANVNLGSSFGTPLTWAVTNGNVDITRLLLIRGAKPDNGGPSVTPLAAVLLYTMNAKPQPDSLIGLTVQISPDTPHNRRLAQQIKEKELEQEVRQYVGFRPGALEKRHDQGLQIISLLLAYGANVNLRGGGGSTPLMNAALAGSLEAARLLVDKGALINAKDESGMTALFYASLSGATNLVKFLINKGADANAQGKEGSTAMFNAVQRQDVEMVRFLLDHKANPNLSPEHSETPLGMAKRFGNPEIVTLLKNAGAHE